MKYLTHKKTGVRLLVYDRKEVMAEFNISERTLYRWQSEGMPVLKFGYWSWFPIAQVRGWAVLNYPFDENEEYFF